MARIPKPVIRRCINCGEAFEHGSLYHHYKDVTNINGTKANCKPTATLLADGWTQTQTGYWIIK